MRIVTPLDRLLQLGGDGVTMLFWLLAVAGALAFVLTDLPEALSMGMAGTGTTMYWLRFRNITVAELLT
ncbi:hypothetical protein SAMN05216559_2485 [Halomicrobium zhouii]|uniref:Uncharacterized protein n=1 Tax=Halomicrobium zhouii TaxID=767519 RepID=A0A1I6LCY1_9EURY|nr:hypothetical protein [Halomicrobium zhouii]SFS01352.1 hypothetical protein SAMN05216559_2485 [Halomicrobium zhouii]